MASSGGQPGNKNATKNRPISDMLYRICVQEDWERLRKALEKTLDKAVEGDKASLDFITDRTEGKVPQPVEAKIDAEVNISIKSYSGD